MTIGMIADTRLSAAPVSQVVHPRFDAPADVVHPVFGNAFDPFLASGHEGQRPGGVLLAVGAMAGGFTATGIADGQRAGKQILGE